MNKTELVAAISKDTQLSKKDSEAALNAVIANISTSLAKGDKVVLVGFGTFEVRIRKGRKRARNPKTGEPVSVSDHGVAVFRPGRELKLEAWKIGSQGDQGNDADTGDDD